MLDTTTTTTVLLDGLHEPDNAAVWSEFDRRYRPLLMAFARRLGLREPDAADVAQETLTRFVQEYRKGRYDRERGRLRAWLMTLARTRVATHYRKQSGRPDQRGVGEAAGGIALVDLEDERTLTEIWDREQRTLMLREAMDRLESTTRTDKRTIRVFEMLVIRQLPVDAVAREMELSTHDVYQAKSRVAHRLRGILEQIEAAYEEA